MLAALTVSGLPTDQFLFAGFLPPKQAARRTRIAELARVPATLILFEAGPRITETLADLAAALGEREAALCRELTKLHEEMRRGPLATLAGESAAAGNPRRIRPGHRTTGDGAARRRRCRRTPARRAGAHLAQGCGRRSRGRDRAVAANALSAGAGAGRRKNPGERIMARRAAPSCSPAARRPERVAAFRLGLSAESRAAMVLIAKGYRILARRFKTPAGEIDIVARRRRVLVFVEVKARERADDAAEAVTDRSQAAHRRRRRIVALPQSGRRAERHPLRRDPGDAGQNPAAHPQCVRCEPLMFRHPDGQDPYGHDTAAATAWPCGTAAKRR